MADLSLRQYFQLEGADPTHGVRSCCAPSMKMRTINLRSLMSDSRIIHISDLHFTASSKTLELPYPIDSQNSKLKSKLLSSYLINNKAQLRASKVVITGDLTDSGDEDDYSIARDFIDELTASGFDVCSVPGNHDYCIEGNLSFESTRFDRKDTADNRGRRDRFIQFITGYAEYPKPVKLNNGLLILLDSMEGELDENNILVPTDDHWAQGKIGTKQWSKLEKCINDYQKERQKGKRLVVALHHSPFHKINSDDKTEECDGTKESDSKGGFNQATDFLNLIKNQIDCLLFGHTSPDGVLQQNFPKCEEKYSIPMINCENLEHLAWKGETKFKGDSAVQICVGQNQDGRLEIFYVGTNGNIYHNWQTAPNGNWSGEPPNDGWSGEAAMGGQALQVCVGQNQDGRLEIFYVGTNFGIYHNWQTSPNGGWSGEARFGHDSARQICVGQNQDGRLEIFYVGTNWNIYHNWQTTPNGNWSGEAAMGGQALQICVGQNYDRRLEIFYIGTNGSIYHNWQTTPNGNWAGEETLDGFFNRAGQICVGRNLDGRLEIFYVGTDMGIFHNWQIIPGAAYPITVLDLESYRKVVYKTDGSEPERSWGNPP